MLTTETRTAGRPGPTKAQARRPLPAAPQAPRPLGDRLVLSPSRGPQAQPPRAKPAGPSRPALPLPPRPAAPAAEPSRLDAFFDHAATQAAAELPAFPMPGPLVRPLGILGVSAGVHAAWGAFQEEGGPDLWGVAEGLGNAAYCLADALGLEWTQGGGLGSPLGALGKVGALGALLAGVIGSVRGAQALLKGEDEEGERLVGRAKTQAILGLLSSAAQALGGAMMLLPATQVAGAVAIALGGALSLGAIGLAAWPELQAKLEERSGAEAQRLARPRAKAA